MRPSGTLWKVLEALPCASRPLCGCSKHGLHSERGPASEWFTQSLALRCLNAPLPQHTEKLGS